MENCDSFKPNKNMHLPASFLSSVTYMMIDDYKQKQHKHPVFDVIQLKPLRCTIKSQRPSWPGVRVSQREVTLPHPQQTRSQRQTSGHRNTAPIQSSTTLTPIF